MTFDQRGAFERARQKQVDRINAQRKAARDFALQRPPFWPPYRPDGKLNVEQLRYEGTWSEKTELTQREDCEQLALLTYTEGR